MPVDVFRSEGGEGLIVHNDNIGRRAGLENAQGLLEILGADGRVVLEEHIHALAPGHVGVAGVVPLNDEEDLETLQHIVGVGVGAHAHQNPLLEHLEHGGAAHGVAHVGLGVIDHHRPGLLDDVHFSAVDMDAVAQKGLVAQNSVVQQAAHRAAAIVSQGVVHVVHALGHMDVEAGHAVVGLHHALKGLVADGEEGVAAEHGLDHVVVRVPGPPSKVGVLLNGLEGLLLAVPVGDLVAQAGAHPQLPAHILDGEEAAGDLAKAGVVVEDGGHAVPDAVQHSGVGAGAGAVHGEVAVDVPPHPLQDLQKVGGVVALDAQAPGQPRVDVGVGVDEAGHNDLALCVHELRIGVLGPHIGQCAHSLDGLAVDDHGAVLKIGVFTVAGDELSVADQQHGNSSIHCVPSGFMYKNSAHYEKWTPCFRCFRHLSPAPNHKTSNSARARSTSLQLIPIKFCSLCTEFFF